MLGALLLDRHVIVLTALAGAAISVVGSTLIDQRTQRSSLLARRVTRLGYAISSLSVLLWIAAGFTAGR